LHRASQADGLVADAFDRDVARVGRNDPSLSRTANPFASTANMLAQLFQSEGIDAAVASVHTEPMIRQLVQVAQRSVKETLRYAMNEGWDPQRTVRELRPAIGLDPRSVVALRNYDKTLRASGTPPGVVKQRVAEYRDRLRTQRTRVVARTQVTHALNAGRYQQWTNRAHAGTLDPATLVEWIVAPDDKTCAVCLALSGLKVPFGKPFATTTGTVLHPPAHPNCRCTVIVITP
jgi:hypothetical protein